MSCNTNDNAYNFNYPHNNYKIVNYKNYLSGHFYKHYFSVYISESSYNPSEHDKHSLYSGPKQEAQE